jgi:hypothetical protein
VVINSRTKSAISSGAYHNLGALVSGKIGADVCLINVYLVHSFLARRIFLLSNKNWFMTAPVVRMD